MPVRYVAVSSFELDHLRDVRLRPEKPDANERMWVTLLVRTRGTEKERLKAIEDLGAQAPGKRKRLTLKEYQRRFGCSSSDFRKITSFAKKSGLQVVKAIPASGAIRLTGKIGAFSKAFAVELVNYESPDLGVYRSHAGPVKIPASLAPMIDGVFGFDARPMNATPFAHAATQPIRFTDPAEVAAAYRFPAGSQGKGQSIAIIELGGGFHQEDLSAFFANQRQKKPKITVTCINGMRNSPASAGAIQKAWEQSGMQSLGHRLLHTLPARVSGTRNESPDAYEDPDSPLNVLWTIESTVDIEVAGALANEAQIRVYYAPNTLQGKFDAYVAALFDQEARPAAISCSWGTHEDTLPAAYIKLIDRVFQCAALLGVTVCHSAGDDGDGSPQGGEPRVHFPASSPHVLAVGGTQLLLAGGVRQETYWDERVGAAHCLGGHGVSKQFGVPAWQAGADVKRKTKREGRGVPDISGKADLHTGYDCVIGQIKIPGGGTSAAAPMWAALIARLNEKLRAPVGYLTPLLYQNQFLGGTNPVGGTTTKEQNGASRWEALTGMGSPDGEGLLAALTSKRR